MSDRMERTQNEREQNRSENRSQNSQQNRSQNQQSRSQSSQSNYGEKRDRMEKDEKNDSFRSKQQNRRFDDSF